jgi:phosphoribosylformimino-5-aminoimidazole carboxamide ribotide isomerase
MIVVPAIDIRGGKVVRLKQGQLQEEKVYGSDPQEVARRWEAEGAARLHVVDLDAAVSGKPQFDVIASVIDAVKIPVEVGGGLRILEIAMRYRERGADRVIFGTAAVADPGVVQEAARLWPGAVAVALDARNGKVAVAGWKEITRVDAIELGQQVKAWGVARLQYTDVLRDGTLLGPNLPGVEAMAKGTQLPITAAGGISVLDDLTRLAALEPSGVDEVIVGKALYERRFTLIQARELLAP